MWNIFEQSPLEDETISNELSSRGIYKIRSDDEVERYPSVKASVQNQKMVIAIDKSVLLLEDEMVAKCSFLSFNESIDVIAISQTGNLVICGLRDGDIYGVFIKGVSLFNMAIRVDDIQMTGKTFTNIQQRGKRFYLSCTNGSVYYLSDIDEAPLESYLNISINEENENMVINEGVLGEITIQRLYTNWGLKEVSDTVILSRNNNLEAAADMLCIAGTGNAVHFKSSTETCVKICIPDRYEGVKHIFNLENYILILTNSGHLLQGCPWTKTINYSVRKRTSLIIDEMIIMECSDDNIELLILTKPTPSEGRTMKIIEYPTLKCKSELEVSEHSWLVQQPKCSVNLYYLSGCNLNVLGNPSEVEMVTISETHPSERFKKLIAKGHLEEAEDFGRQFELCLQPIYEAKAKRILVKLSTLGNSHSEVLDDCFSDLLQVLGMVENKSFFKSNRMVNLPSRKILKKYLNEILKHLDSEDDEGHILDITEQLHRLETLAIIDPYECDSEWQKFVYNSNLVRMITGLFKTDLPTACLIWKRHSSALIPYLEEKDLRKLLILIPNNSEAFNLVLWLRQFAPTVTKTHPNIMPYITEWSIEKTRALQFADHWPDIGLEFCTKVLEIFEEIQFIHSDVRRQYERNIVRLRDLVNALQDLAVLKKSYKLVFTLDNYLQDSIEDTTLCILQRAHLYNLKSLVNDFLNPIFQEKGKTPADAIRRYIALLVANRNGLSTWLERAVACVELLHNEDDRLESALLVLQNSPVPWPDTVAPLIKLRYSTHPLALKISTEYEIQVVKIMKVKYGWPADSVANLDLFMFRIVKMDLPDMLDDICALIKAAPEIATSAVFNCCYQMVLRGKPEMAYEFFKSLQADKKLMSTDEVIELFTTLLENSNDQQDNNEQEELIEFFKLISIHGSSSTQKRLAAIQNRFTLVQQFRLRVDSISDLTRRKERLKLLDLGIGNIIERSQGTVNVPKFITSTIAQLTGALQMQKMFGIHRLCARMRCLPLTCALAYTMLESVDCVAENKNDFIEMALELLAQQIVLNKSSNSLAASSQFKENDPLAFPLIYDLLVRATGHEKTQSHELIELIKYVRLVSNGYDQNAIADYYSGREREINENICKALEVNTTDSALNSTGGNGSFEEKTETTKKRYSVSVFDEIEVMPQQPKKRTTNNEQISILRFVSRTLNLMVLEKEPINSLLLKLRHLLIAQAKDDIDGAREDFFISLEQLIKAKIHNVWYIMALYLLDYQKHNNCRIINSDFVSLQLGRVFRNVMSQKDVNFIDLFVMLVTDNHSARLLEKLSIDLKTDQQKVNLLTLSEMYNVHLEKADNVEAIRTKRIKHHYYMEFCKQDATIKGKFNADIDNIEQLLKEFRNKQLGINLLERMSRDFGLDYEQMLITQVISILHAQELQYEIKPDAFGDEELCVISNAEEIRNLCQPYIQEIKNTELLGASLMNFIKEINIYFYELYLCVVEILSYIDAAPKELVIWSSILHFLKHKMLTRRRSRPGQLEMDMWLQSQTDIGVLPKIARYRLPFKPLVENPLIDILDNELNVDNCESWIPLIQMHALLKGSKEPTKIVDYFTLSAVKNSIGEYKTSDTETWHLQPTNNAFLKSILRLITHVHETGKTFIILYFVANNAPFGADQVEASHECYTYGLENFETISQSKYREELITIKRKFPILKTQHLLHVYGLTDEKLMRLVEHPMDLILNLYYHDVVVKACKLDVNTVVKEIADLHGLDLEVLQFHLLQKWLSFSFDNTDGTVLDDTFFEDQNGTNQVGEDAGDAAENVIRANCILSSWPTMKAVQFLVAHIFPSDGGVHTSKQLQMYECFSKLNDGSASFNNMLNQRQYITIKCVHELKQLGYNFTPEKFAACNKLDVLKKIWQRSVQNPHTIEILANICLGFDIYLSKIWNGILKRMVMFNMVKELNALVDVLSCQPQLLQTDGLTAAWDCVLKHPLKNATRSVAQDEVLHNTLFRLQSCPVAHKLNLLEFAEHCVHLDRPYMAAVVMALCKNANQNASIKKLVFARKTATMRKQILELEDAGILPAIINLALKELKL